MEVAGGNDNAVLGKINGLSVTEFSSILKVRAAFAAASFITPFTGGVQRNE